MKNQIQSLFFAIAFIALPITSTFGQLTSTTYRSDRKSFEWSGTSQNPTLFAKFNIEKIETRDLIFQEWAECKPVSCKTSLDGSSGSWGALYSSSGSTKAEQLAAVVKGIPPFIAKRLVALDYFRSRPVSWQSFMSEIVNAQNAIYADGVAFNFTSAVLEQYGHANALALGYFDAAQCTAPEAYSCSIPTIRTETRSLGTFQRQLKLEINQAKLLPFETESVVLSMGGMGEGVKLLLNADGTKLLNDYAFEMNEVSENEVIASLSFKSRKMSAVNTIFAKKLSSSKNGYDVTSAITLDIGLMKQILTPGSRIEVDHGICRRGLLGGCAEEISRRTDVLNISDIERFDYRSSSYIYGKTYHGFMRFRIQGSEYFSNSWTGFMESAKFTY